MGRIAADFPNDVDWEQVLQRLEAAAHGVVIEPMYDAIGPSFNLVETPPGMTALEAHNLVAGMIEPVVIGP